MDQLRLILLIVGVLLIAGIFVWELIKKRAHERRRAQIVEHLDPDERAAHAGDSVLGGIGQVDPVGGVQHAPGRRSRDGLSDADADADENAFEADDLADYDIDEDFPGEPEAPPTQAPRAGTVEATATRAPDEPREDRWEDPRGDAALESLSGLKARRDAPEQLDLAGLDLSATPWRAGDAAAPAPGGERRNPRPSGDEELHIIMTVMAKSGSRFSGGALRDALERAELYHGEMNIFHRHEQPNDPTTPTLFSVANVLAPGHFEPERIEGLSSPGIAMFMRLPGPERPSDAFQLMLDAAKTVADDLDGTLCDESRSTLTPQSINHLRERIADFGRRQMLKA